MKQSVDLHKIKFVVNLEMRVGNRSKTITLATTAPVKYIFHYKPLNHFQKAILDDGDIIPY